VEVHQERRAGRCSLGVCGTGEDVDVSLGWNRDAKADTSHDLEPVQLRLAAALRAQAQAARVRARRVGEQKRKR
jgi:hypothetical protein